MGKKQAGQQAEAPKKKGKKKWIVIAVVVVVLLAAVIGGGDKDPADSTGSSEPSTPAVTEPAEQVTESTGESEPGSSDAAEYTLEHGELVSAIANEIDGRSVLVIKAKISSSYNNTATVDQNYYNVADLIQSQGCDVFDELQYWAVADMSDGSEQKVVSFTVDADLIQKIAAGEVVENQLGDYVTDLYILPSLAE